MHSYGDSWRYSHVLFSVHCASICFSEGDDISWIFAQDRVLLSCNTSEYIQYIVKSRCRCWKRSAFIWLCRLRISATHPLQTSFQLGEQIVERHSSADLEKSWCTRTVPRVVILMGNCEQELAAYCLDRWGEQEAGGTALQCAASILWWPASPHLSCGSGNSIFRFFTYSHRLPMLLPFIFLSRHLPNSVVLGHVACLSRTVLLLWCVFHWKLWAPQMGSIFREILRLVCELHTPSWWLPINKWPT